METFLDPADNFTEKRTSSQAFSCIFGKVFQILDILDDYSL